MKNGPSLEKIIAFYQVVPYLSTREVSRLRSKLSLTDADLDRYWGRDIEEQFYIMLLFRNNVESIVPFSEQLSQLTNTATPDVLLLLKNGNKLLVEIKASSKDSKKISEGRIRRQIQFASKLGFPLYYLFLIGDKWGLLEADVLLKVNRKISVVDFVSHSKFEEVFGIHFVNIPKGLTVTCVSSSAIRNTIGIKSRHGVPLKFVVRTGNGICEVNTKSRSSLARFVAALVNFCGWKPTITTNGSITEQVYCFEEEVLIADFQFILILVRNTLNRKNKRLFSAADFITFLLEHHDRVKTLFSIDDLVIEPVGFLRQHSINIELYKPPS